MAPNLTFLKIYGIIYIENEKGALTMNALEKLLREEGFTCKVDFTKDDFGYDWDKDILYVGAPVEPELEMWFVQFLHEYGGDVRGVDYAVLPLLHELGHVSTVKWFSEAELFSFHVFKTINNAVDDADYGVAVRYWECEDEFVANLWVIDYIFQNFERVSALAAALHEARG